MEKQTQTQTQAKSFNISDDFRKWVQTILGKRPYVEIAGIFNLLSKEILNESEINAILGEMGKCPYNDVFQFFIGIQSMVKEQSIQQPDVTEVKSKVK